MNPEQPKDTPVNPTPSPTGNPIPPVNSPPVPATDKPKHTPRGPKKHHAPRDGKTEGA